MPPSSSGPNVGKIRLTRSPWLNHSWHVALYVTPRGLTTSPIPDGFGTFQIDFDFMDHVLRVATSDGKARQFALAGLSVQASLRHRDGDAGRARIKLVIDDMPNELAEPTRFPQDTAHASYDPEAVQRFLQILINCDRLFKQFRTVSSARRARCIFSGQLRSGGDPFFRPARAAPSGRRPRICPIPLRRKPIRTK